VVRVWNGSGHVEEVAVQLLLGFVKQSTWLAVTVVLMLAFILGGHALGWTPAEIQLAELAVAVLVVAFLAIRLALSTRRAGRTRTGDLRVPNAAR
jgi:hypothetical protein